MNRALKRHGHSRLYGVPHIAFPLLRASTPRQKNAFNTRLRSRASPQTQTLACLLCFSFADTKHAKAATQQTPLHEKKLHPSRRLRHCRLASPPKCSRRISHSNTTKFSKPYTLYPHLFLVIHFWVRMVQLHESGWRPARKKHSSTSRPQRGSTSLSISQFPDFCFFCFFLSQFACFSISLLF